MTTRPLSVLCDLRPAFDGHYGIPHEARLMFRLLHGLNDVSVTGLINHPSKLLARTFRRGNSGNRLPLARQIQAYSRLAASIGKPEGLWDLLSQKAISASRESWLQLLISLGVPISLDHFDGTNFGDFLWQSLFSRSLPPTAFELCRTAQYASLWSSWLALHASALIPGRRYARVDTDGYDVFIAHTPWPGTVAPETQLVIRYHDSMPVFLPHTVKQSRLHQYFHMSALASNAKSAAFACVSEFSRAQLLQISPELENRAFVVQDCIADDYFPSDATTQEVKNIILSRHDDGVVETEAGVPAQGQPICDAHLATDDFRFILVVGTLEPRKNHLGLLTAWDALKSNLNRPTAIVSVGSTGWSNTNLLRAMQKWQVRGELFHLSSVPPSEMRSLYAAADVVVCPSVSEGFDLPSVEAIRCGAAVAASDIPTHREMLGDAALYFDPYSTESMANTIARLLDDGALKQRQRHKSKAQAPKFDTSVVEGQWQLVLDHCRKSRPAAWIKSPPAAKIA